MDSPRFLWWPRADQFAKRTKTAKPPEGQESARADSSPSNCRHADFQLVSLRFNYCFINQLPGCPLPILQHNAGQFRTKPRKIHARMSALVGDSRLAIRNAQDQARARADLRHFAVDRPPTSRSSGRRCDRPAALECAFCNRIPDVSREVIWKSSTG